MQNNPVQLKPIFEYLVLMPVTTNFTLFKEIGKNTNVLLFEPSGLIGYTRFVWDSSNGIELASSAKIFLIQNMKFLISWEFTSYESYRYKFFREINIVKEIFKKYCQFNSKEEIMMNEFKNKLIQNEGPRILFF